LTAYIVTYSDSGFHQDLSEKKITFIYHTSFTASSLDHKNKCTKSWLTLR